MCACVYVRVFVRMCAPVCACVCVSIASNIQFSLSLPPLTLGGSSSLQCQRFVLVLPRSPSSSPSRNTLESTEKRCPGVLDPSFSPFLRRGFSLFFCALPCGIALVIPNRTAGGLQTPAAALWAHSRPQPRVAGPQHPQFGTCASSLTGSRQFTRQIWEDK